MRRLAVFLIVIVAAAAAVWFGFASGMFSLDGFRSPDVVSGVAPVATAPDASVLPQTASKPCGADVEVAGAPSYPERPVFQLELREHTGAVRSIAVSASGDLAATAGWDKSIRLWSLPPAGEATGPSILKQVEVLRVPVGAADTRTGEAYAVAISPDGSLVAVGGQMADSDNPLQERVYVFDRQTTRIVAVLPIANIVRALSFSRDGRFLAAGAGGGVGLCVWESGSWAQRAHDGAYDGDVRGVAFGPATGLVTTSDDGNLRLYGADFKLVGAPLRVRDNVNGSRGEPWSVSFSPAGKLIAVGYHDSADVTVHDAARPGEFAVLRALSGTGDVGSVYPRVAWSGDGKSVFAAGSTSDRQEAGGAVSLLRRWPVDEAASIASLRTAVPQPKDHTVLGAAGTVQALAAAGSDRMIAVTRDGVMGLVNGNGLLDAVRKPLRLSWTGTGRDGAASALGVSDDGHQVLIPVANAGALLFDAHRRTLVKAGSSSSATPQGMAFTRLSLRGSTVTLDAGCAPGEDTCPRLKPPGGAEPVELEKDVNERAYSHAFGPQGGMIAVGTGFNLRLYDAEGASRGSIPVPEAVHRIVVSLDETMVVVALGDGTVRWYEVKRDDNSFAWQIKPRLSLFVKPDDLKWAMWTPQEYYDAAPDAEGLLGWLVNRGALQSSLFYSSGSFRDLFRRPDLIDRALKAGLLQRLPSTSAFLASVPPVIRIVSVTQSGPARARVSYQMDWPLQSSDRSAVVTGAIDSATSGNRGFTAVVDNNFVELDVPVGSGLRRVTLQAQTRNLRVSDVAVQEDIPLTVEAAPRPVLRAVVAGVSDYLNPTSGLPNLNYADDDARILETLLAAQQGEGRLYQAAEITRLIDAGARKDEILQAMRKVASAAQAHDVTVLFLAGHGTFQVEQGEDEERGAFYFLPHDSRVANGRVDPAHAISIKDITDNFLRLARGRKIVFLDACRSGQIARFGVSFAEAMRSGSDGIFVLAASSGEQPAVEDAGFLGGHGAFTAAIMEAFYDKPDFQIRRGSRTFFRVDDLSGWVKDRVPELTSPDQTPVAFDNSGAGFPFAEPVRRATP